MVILHCYVSVWMYYQGRHLIIITTTTITTSLVSVCSPTCLWSFAGIIFIFQIMDMVAIFLGGLQDSKLKTSATWWWSPLRAGRNGWISLCYPTVTVLILTILMNIPCQFRFPLEKNTDIKPAIFFVQMVDPQIPMEISHLSQRSAPDSDDFELHDKTLFL